jgi:hypothetical protein
MSTKLARIAVAPVRVELPRPELLRPLAPAQVSASPEEHGAVEALRRRLGSTAREHVVLDFLEDDLREARGALSAVASYVANVEAALSDAELSPPRLLSLAKGGGPGERVDDLAQLLANMRRRLAQVAARM